MRNGKLLRAEIKAIPTTYAGVNMRSRLEARWANLFDQFGWKWFYEPLEFDDWIPDFVIDGHNNTPLLIDVKPYRAFPEGDSLDVKIRRPLWNNLDKYNLFVTRAYPTDCIGGDTCLVGWVSESWTDEEGEHFCWDDAAITHPYYHKNDFGLSAFNHSYVDRISGHYDGSLNPLSKSEFMVYWHRALNATQWKRAA